MTLDQSLIVKNEVSIVAMPRPFSDKRVLSHVIAGCTVSDALKMSGMNDPILLKSCVVFIGDQKIDPILFDKVRPKAGAHMSVRVVPMGGGGGKSPLKLVLMVAFMAVGGWAAGAFANSLALGATGAGVATAGQVAVAGAVIKGAVSLVGTLITSALIPPSSPTSPNQGSAVSTSPTLAITGSRNRANPFGVIPRIYGTHKIFPLHAAKPFAEVVGDDQFLRMLFCFGVGPLEMSDLKIGTIPIADFEDVQYNYHDGSTAVDLSIYTNIVEQDQYSIAVYEATGSQTVVTQIDADEFVLDLTFAGLVSFTDTQKRNRREVEATVEYRPTSGGAWTAIASDAGINTPVTDISVVAGVTRVDTFENEFGSDSRTVVLQENVFRSTSTNFRDADILAGGQVTSTSAGTITTSGFANPANNGTFNVTSVGDNEVRVSSQLTTEAAGASVTMATERTGGNLFFGDNTEQLVRKPLTVKTGSRDTYEIKVTRITVDSTADTIRDEMSITALRTITYGTPIARSGLALLEMRIRATDQLNGVVDELSAIMTAKLSKWNGSAWGTPVATRNPAWAYADVLRGTSNKRPIADARIDGDALLSWANACDAAAQDGEAYWTFDAVLDANGTVFSALAQISSAGRAAFGMSDSKFSVVRDSLQTTPIQNFSPRNSSGFAGSKIFTEIPHGLKLRFIDPVSDYEQRETIAYADGYTSANATKFETMELVGVTRQAQAWREGRYHLAVGTLRPDTYEINVDIENIICTRGDLVRVQHDVVRWGQQTARVKTVNVDGSSNVTSIIVDDFFTMSTGTAYTSRFRLSDGSNVTATPDTVDGESTTLTYTTNIPAADAPAIGDLVMFGESSLESVELIIKEILPGPDFTARIVMIDAAPAVHTADTGTIPAYSPQITTDPVTSPPKAVVGLVATEESVTTSGRFTYHLNLTWQAPSASFGGSYEVYLHNGNRFVLHDVVRSTFYRFNDVVRGDDVRAAVIAVSPSGAKIAIGSAPNINHTIVGVIPADVTGLSATIRGDTIRLEWTNAIGVDHWRVRFSPDVAGVTWGSAVDLSTSVRTPVFEGPARVGTYLVKAVDVDGFESTNETSVVTTAAGLNALNVITTQSEHPSFAGAHTNTVAASSLLQLTASALFDDGVGLFDDGLGLFDAGGGTIVASGSYDFANYIDLTGVFTSRVTASIKSTGINMTDLFDSGVGLFDSGVGLFDGEAPGEVDVVLQISTTDDDPAGAPTWSSFAPFVVGDYSARAFKFKAVLTSTNGFMTPQVSELTVTIDMPDRIDGAEDIVASSGGEAVTFSTAFKVQPAIAITGENMATGDYFEVTSKSATGFTVQFKNSGGTGIARTFDWIAKGYGAVV